MKILDAFWFTQTHTPQHFGIVKVESGHPNRRKEIKFYIGMVPGINEKEDALRIAGFGAKVPANELRRFLKDETPPELISREIRNTSGDSDGG